MIRFSTHVVVHQSDQISKYLQATLRKSQQIEAATTKEITEAMETGASRHHIRLLVVVVAAAAAAAAAVMAYLITVKLPLHRVNMTMVYIYREEKKAG